jgi:hypothetical protein
VDELFERISNGEVWKRQNELQAEADKDLESLQNEEEEEWETDEEGDGASETDVNSEAETEPDLFDSADESRVVPECALTPELFSTPSGPKTKKYEGRTGGEKQKNMIAKILPPRFPSSKRQVGGNCPTSISHIF